MKYKFLIMLKILLTVLIGIYLGYMLFVNKETDYNSMAKLVIVFLGCILSLVRGKRKPIGRNYRRYEEAYKDFLEGAFSEDKKSYKDLLNCAVCHNRDQYAKAYKLLDKLEKKCTRMKDYAAVYGFRGLCYAEEGRHQQASEAYEKALQYDMANDVLWSNLGASYVQIGKAKEAYDAFKNAIMYNPNDAYVHNNLADYYIRMVEPELALQYALKSIELNAKLYEAMGYAAIAYKMLGDEQNAEKYCKMYCVNGGNGNGLRARLEAV